VCGRPLAESGVVLVGPGEDLLDSERGRPPGFRAAFSAAVDSSLERDGEHGGATEPGGVGRRSLPQMAN
jgi:hypothetical protein